MQEIEQKKKIIRDRIRELDFRKNTLRIDRKIEFLLDIRGYFIVNRIKGSYVEFGCFNGEMLFAAFQILNPRALCRRFIGLDTFEGEPQLSMEDARHNKFNLKGDYNSSYKLARDLAGSESKSVRLIKGDFRKDAIQKKIREVIKKDKINVAVIDCNLLTSIRSAADLILHYIKSGGVLFVDDFYTNMNQGKVPVGDILEESASRLKKRLYHYKCYPPFAEAFIVLHK